MRQRQFKNVQGISGSLSRRGATYALVLGTSLLVATISMGSLMAVRSQAETARLLGEATAAANLALSGVSYARLKIKADPEWRTTYASGTWSAEQPLGGGVFTWKVVDATTGGSVRHNGVSAAFDTASVRLYSKGRIGSVEHTTSVILAAQKVPMDVLRTTMHCEDLFYVAAPVTTTGGPVSTNGLLLGFAKITGAAESGSYYGFSSITGGLTTPAPQKPLPDQAVFDVYRDMATEIPYSSGGSWTVSWPLLSSGVNPTGSGTNARAIYYIRVPTGRVLTLQIKRILGTLIIDCEDGASVRQWDPVCWAPQSTDLPILLIRHATNTYVEDWIEAGASAIVETDVGVNLNPAHTPYLGASNDSVSTSDVYPSRLHGLIHIMSPHYGNSSYVLLGNQVNILGTLICEQRLQTTDGGSTNLNHDPDLFDNPPLGYCTLNMLPAAGSWKQELSP